MELFRQAFNLRSSAAPLVRRFLSSSFLLSLGFNKLCLLVMWGIIRHLEVLFGVGKVGKKKL